LDQYDELRPAATRASQLRGDVPTTAAPCSSTSASPAASTPKATFADVGGTASPTPLLTYSRALNDAAIKLDFQQHVGQTDLLRSGKYSRR
jgi:hypothetical protein